MTLARDDCPPHTGLQRGGFAQRWPNVEHDWSISPLVFLSFPYILAAFAFHGSSETIQIFVPSTRRPDDSWMPNREERKPHEFPYFRVHFCPIGSCQQWQSCPWKGSGKAPESFSAPFERDQSSVEHYSSLFWNCPAHPWSQKWMKTFLDN